MDCESEGQYLGVTPPISLAEPTDIEVELAEELETYISSLGIYEEPHGIEARNKLVHDLEKIVKQWATETLSKAENATGQADDHGTHLLAYGGHKLGVVMKDSDIDVVCVAPESITELDFFSTLVEHLHNNSKVTSIRAVRGARMPVIKLVVQQISVDMSFASLPVAQISSEIDLTDMALLSELEDTSLLSITGYLETDTILGLVPDVEVFLKVLKVIKYWAKCKKIYSSTLSFLSGIGWTVMVARICQLYPYANHATLVNRFFKIYANWVWPQPVLLKNLEDDKFDLQPWNPAIIAADRLHLMPVITPTCPEKNCAFNVIESTRTIMQELFKEGADVTDNILEKKSEWKDLFTQPAFFKKYKHFLMISAKAGNEQDLLDWSGLVESKLRLLVQSFEKQECVVMAHPLPQAFKSMNDEILTRWLIGLEFDKAEGIQLDLGQEVKSFRTTLKEHAIARNIFRKGMQIEIAHVRRKLLSKHLPQEVLHH